MTIRNTTPRRLASGSAGWTVERLIRDPILAGRYEHGRYSQGATGRFSSPRL